MANITKQVQIDASSEKVWEVLADLGAAHKWVPAVVKSYYTSDARTGVGASRRCELFPEGAVDEIVLGWDDKQSIRYSVGGFGGPIESVVNEITLSSIGDRTQATLTMELGVNGPEEVRQAVEEQMGQAITDALAGLKYHVETGELVGNELPESAMA